jgi:hypothetical protein
MKRLCEADGKFTPEGAILLQKVISLLRPVFSEFIEKGYETNDIAQQVHQAVGLVERA